MGSNSIVVKLKDISVKITKGTTPSKSDGGFSESGINYIKAESVSYDGRIDESTFAFIDDSVHKKLKRSQLEENDILFSMAGAYLGKTGFVTKKHLPANTNQALALIRVNSEIAHPKFVHYCLQQKTIIYYVNNSISQSAQPNINLQQIGDLDIILPPKDDQAKVVSYMSKLDNKITLNRQINQTLEQMAQALFKSWFVDFDPVIDNALDAGFFEQDLEFSGELLHRAEARKAARESADFKPLPEEIHQLFPAAFEECSEPSLGLGGWVPEGWNHGCISDVARYRTERVNTVELTFDNYISTENMLVDRKGVQPATSLPTINSVPAYTSGTVLVSNIRPYFKKIWLAKGDGGYSNDVLGFEAKVSGTESYLFNLMYQDTFFDFMMATSKGSKMPRGDKKAILGWDLVVPTLSLRLFFSEKVNDFYTSADSRHHENITLNQLRDTLLPKLISGELRLIDSEVDTAEEVLA